MFSTIVWLQVWKNMNSWIGGSSAMISKAVQCWNSCCLLWPFQGRRELRNINPVIFLAHDHTSFQEACSKKIFDDWCSLPGLRKALEWSLSESSMKHVAELYRSGGACSKSIFEKKYSTQNAECGIGVGSMKFVTTKHWGVKKTD